MPRLVEILDSVKHHVTTTQIALRDEKISSISNLQDRGISLFTWVNHAELYIT